MPPIPMYEYFEERLINQSRPSRRRKNAGARLAGGATLEELSEHFPSQYPWWRTRELEGRADVGLQEGVWPINHCRVERYYGDPGVARCPYNTKPSEWPADIHELARRFRLHHYFRAWTSAECRDLVLRGIEVRTALEVTEDWHDPPEGVIEIPDPASPILGSHAVPVIGYDRQNDRLLFPNSWGRTWGDRSKGAFSPAIFDRYLIEAWCRVGVGIDPPVEARSGLVCLLWKSGLGGQEVHGREVVDASSGERLAWTFLVRRGKYLDVEEFYVWPAHRRKGYARKLAELVREFVRQSGLGVRAWVPFADAGPENRPALLRTLQLVGLNLHPSPHRSAAFLASAEPYSGLLPVPRIPDRPAVIREKLSPEAGTRLYTVWFGTDRKPNDPADPGKGYSIRRDERIHYGTCKVSIPRSHRFGSVGSSWFRRWLRSTDDRLRVAERSQLEPEEFWQEIEASLQGCDPDERQGLVFLHGYNVDFDEAAVRAAQIGFDLKVPGVTAFFSWPSCGTTLGYLADEACIEASEYFIAEFLTSFVRRSGAQRVHLIAHSMGSRGLLRALHRITATLSREAGVPFGQIILAAPDIDAGLFATLAEVFPRSGQRTTLYASPADHAIGLSRWLHRYHRAGLTPPVTVVEGVDTIEVPTFNILDLLGHGYFAEAEGLLHDMFNLLRWNADPNDRQRLAPAQTPDGLGYWVMNS